MGDGNVDVDVDVDGNVAEPVAVAALVNGNANVYVAGNVADRDATRRRDVRQRCMLHFQKLDVYQRSIEFLALARRAGALPRGHAELADQLRRAAQSIPQTIAEGAGRTTRADKARHFAIARGSAMECAAHLDVMRVEELAPQETYAQGMELLERIVAMLTKLIDP